MSLIEKWKKRWTILWDEPPILSIIEADLRKAIDELESKYHPSYHNAFKELKQKLFGSEKEDALVADSKLGEGKDLVNSLQLPSEKPSGKEEV